MKTLIRTLCTVLAPLLTVGGSGCSPAPAEATTLRHGPFEIVAQGRRVSSGAFPNTSANPFATIEVTGFAVRWQGREVTVPDVGNRFWRVLRLPDAPRPALLVATTQVHLVSELDGRLEVRRLGPAGTDVARLQWLDSEGGQPGAVRHYGVEKVMPDDGTLLRGGRWVRVGHHTVLDVQTLQPHPVTAWIASGSGHPLQGLNASNSAARALSPGQTRFVLVGSDRDPRRDQADYDGLVVVDIAGGEADGLRLDRRRTRYAQGDEIDAAWIAHHFRWQRDALGHEQLVARSDAPPWPWRGRVLDFGGGNVEYRVPRMAPAFVDVVQRVAVERLQAEPGPGAPGAPSAAGSGAGERRLRVPGCESVLVLSATADHVGVHVSAPSSPPGPRCQDAVRQLGAAVDAELAAGRHDAYIVLE